MSFAVPAAFVRDLTQRLVKIDSVNPSLDAARSGEGEAAELLAEVAEELSMDVELLEPESGRVTVVATRKGRGGGKSLMLNAHIDTVGVEGMEDPFSGFVDGDKLYGRGSFDMKGAMAACFGAVKILEDSNITLNGDLVVTGVADEEYGSLGARHLLETVKTDAAIVTEPTHLNPCLAHKGYVWLTVRTLGRAAHGSRFEEGIDANMRMGRVLAELEKLERELRARAPHPLVGPPSLHAALLQGGTGVSTYAGSSDLTIERRTVPGETPALVEKEIREILVRLAEADNSFEAELDVFFERNPFEVSPEAAIVKIVDDAVERTLGERRSHVGDTPWMDAALMAEAGIETVVIGPSGAGAHAKEEWVDLKSVERLSEILAHAAVLYCGTPDS